MLLSVPVHGGVHDPKYGVVGARRLVGSADAHGGAHDVEGFGVDVLRLLVGVAGECVVVRTILRAQRKGIDTWSTILCVLLIDAVRIRVVLIPNAQFVFSVCTADFEFCVMPAVLVALLVVNHREEILAAHVAFNNTHKATSMHFK